MHEQPKHPAPKGDNIVQSTS